MIISNFFGFIPNIEYNLFLIESLPYSPTSKTLASVVVIGGYIAYIWLTVPTKREYGKPDEVVFHIIWFIGDILHKFIGIPLFLYEKTYNLNVSAEQKKAYVRYSFFGMMIFFMSFRVFLINPEINNVDSSVLNSVFGPKTYYCDESGPHSGLHTWPHVDYRDHQSIHYRMGAEMVYWNRQFHNLQTGHYDVPKFNSWNFKVSAAICEYIDDYIPLKIKFGEGLYYINRNLYGNGIQEIQDYICDTYYRVKPLAFFFDADGGSINTALILRSEFLAQYSPSRAILLDTLTNHIYAYEYFRYVNNIIFKHMNDEEAVDIFFANLLVYLRKTEIYVLDLLEDVLNPAYNHKVPQKLTMLDNFLRIPGTHYEVPKYDILFNYGYLLGHVKTNHTVLVQFYNFVTSSAFILPLGPIIIAYCKFF